MGTQATSQSLKATYPTGKDLVWLCTKCKHKETCISSSPAQNEQSYFQVL